MGAAVPTITGLIGGATDLVGAISRASSIRAEARFESRALRAQQRLIEERIRDTIRRGERRALEERRQARVLIGAQRARFAAQGISPDVGTAFDLASQAAITGADEAATQRINAFREALGLRLGIEDLRLRRNLTKIGARVRTTGTLLTGGLAFIRALRQLSGPSSTAGRVPLPGAETPRGRGIGNTGVRTPPFVDIPL